MPKSEEEIVAEAERVQEGIRHQLIELIILVLPDETLITEGQSDVMAAIPEEWVSEARLAQPGAILIHNHPRGGPPSASDFNAAHQMGLLEMRVVGADFTWICREAPGSRWWQMEQVVEEAEGTRAKLSLLSIVLSDGERGTAERAANRTHGILLLQQFPHLRRDPPP